MPLPAIGAMAAQQGLNLGMGIVQGMWNDARQIKQSKKLGKINLDLAKEMANYNYIKQLQMWEAKVSQSRSTVAACISPPPFGASPGCAVAFKEPVVCPPLPPIPYISAGFRPASSICRFCAEYP